MYFVIGAGAAVYCEIVSSVATIKAPQGSLASLPGRGQMHVASAAGDIRRLKALMAEGGDVNTPDKQGRTPLMYALRFDQIRAAQFLLEQGALVDQQTHDKSTALHYACFQGNEHSVKFLTDEAKANARIVDNEGRTPLHWSMHNRSIKVFDALLAHGDLNEADLNARDSSGMTAVMWACCYDSIEHLERLIALGADLRPMDVEGKTAMHWSVRSHQIKCLKKLLSYQNSFDMDRQGRSIIHHAAEVGNKRAIKLIATKRPQSIHDVDDNGRSPLHWAAVCRHVDVLQQLLRLGAYVSRKDVKGKSALQYTVEHEFVEGHQILATAETYHADKPRLGPADASTRYEATRHLIKTFSAHFNTTVAACVRLICQFQLDSLRHPWTPDVSSRCSAWAHSSPRARMKARGSHTADISGSIASRVSCAGASRQHRLRGTRVRLLQNILWTFWTRQPTAFVPVLTMIRKESTSGRLHYKPAAGELTLWLRTL